MICAMEERRRAEERGGEDGGVAGWRQKTRTPHRDVGN